MYMDLIVHVQINKQIRLFGNITSPKCDIVEIIDDALLKWLQLVIVTTIPRTNVCNDIMHICVCVLSVVGIS